MNITLEERKFGLKVIRELSHRDREELCRWSFIWELSQRELPSGAIADDSSEAVLEALRQSCVQQIIRICRFPILGKDAGVGSIKLMRKVWALTRLVTSLADDGGLSVLLEVGNESASANSPEGCPRSDRGHYVENSGIHL